MSNDSQAPFGGPPIGVIGVGYVGLVTAVCFADLGYHVICRDIDAGRIEALRSGRVPIFEPDIEPVLERNRERLQFTLELDPIVRGLPGRVRVRGHAQMHSGDADLSRVHTVIDELAGASEQLILVMKSTVPVGTGDRLRDELEAAGRGIAYVSNPEFLREGRAVARFCPSRQDCDR